MKREFLHSERANPHVLRSRQIIQKYPQIKSFMGPHRASCWWILGVTILQLAIAYALRNTSALGITIMAFGVGALLSHGLFALSHECTHNLVTKSAWSNKLWSIVCNIGQGFPSAIAFREFHIIHHADMGVYERDADLASHWEARLVGGSFIKKTLWYLLFFLVETLRPTRLKTISMWKNPWIYLNIAVILVTNVLVYIGGGWSSLIYLILSTLFGVGLHPVGARWIQEHYVFDEESEQETFSYYGPLNKTCFNVGYHVEHHDLMRVPWVHLPKVKQMAPDFYEPLESYHSWSSLLWRFLTDPKVSLYSRYTRKM